MNFGLTEQLIDRVNAVFKEYPKIEQVLIYGSRAKGTYKEGSDIDLSLKGSDISHDIYTKVAQELEQLNTPYFFDLCIYNTLQSASLIAHIDRVGKVFYSKDSSPLTAK